MERDVQQGVSFCRRRFAVVVVPWFALERHAVVAGAAYDGGDDEPVVLVRVRQNRREVVLVSPGAWRVGVRPGMSATEATAMVPSLVLQLEDAEAEAREWSRLARLGYHYSPLAGLLPPPPQRSVGDMFAQPALWIEVTGTQRLHGGDATLAQRLCDEFAASHGYTAFVAVADTPWAARAAATVLAVEAQATASEAKRPCSYYVVPPGASAEALRDVPLGALPLSGGVLVSLAGLALETLGEVMRIARPTLAARFGDELATVLAELLDEAPLPLVPEPLDARLRVVATLEGPTDRRDSVLFLLKRMCEALHERLRRNAEGARILSLKLARGAAGHEPLKAQVHLSVAQRRAAALFELVRAQVERFDFSHPLDEIELAVEQREPLPNEEATTLFEDDGPEATAQPTRSPAALGALVDRLREHLGPQAVTQWRLCESYVPEAAYEAIPPQAATQGPTPAAPKHKRRRRQQRRNNNKRKPQHAPSQSGSGVPPVAPRPTLLLEPPVRVHLREIGGHIRFEFAGRHYDVLQRTGPERLVTAWWSETPMSRDYLLIRTSQGPTFWAYRETHTTLWLHGLFD